MIRKLNVGIKLLIIAFFGFLSFKSFKCQDWNIFETLNYNPTCDISGSIALCFEYTGSYWNKENAKAHCDNWGVSYSAVFSTGSGCPAQSCVAKCKGSDPIDPAAATDHEVIIYFYTTSGYYPDAASARAVCDTVPGGVFTPGC